MKVAVLGAGGGIGQPLALLLKHSPMVSHLALYDLASYTPGKINKIVTMQISFLNAKNKRHRDVFLCKSVF